MLDANNKVTATFAYATRSHVPDFMVTYNAAGAVTGTYRYVVDHLGSVRMLINTATGAIAQQIDYDAFGKATLASGSTWATQPFAYAGGIYDNETGLTRFGARDYDASTGRWTAKDPILWDGGQTNLYQYVGGDPVNRVDVTGLASPQEKAVRSCVLAAVAAFVACAAAVAEGGLNPFANWACFLAYLNELNECSDPPPYPPLGPPPPPPPPPPSACEQ